MKASRTTRYHHVAHENQSKAMETKMSHKRTLFPFYKKYRNQHCRISVRLIGQKFQGF